MIQPKRVWSLVLILALQLSLTHAPAIASTSLPPSDFADQRDPNSPPLAYADGSPGQYTLTGYQWAQPGGLGTPVTVTYSFQNMFDGGIKMPNGQPLPASIIRGSIEEALGLWSSVAPLNFVEVPDDGLAYGASTHFGQIRFSHIFINGPDPPIGDPVAKAQTYYPPFDGVSGNGLPGDVQFDEGDAWQLVGTFRQPDILGAALHEIGHALGLDHSTGIIPGQFWSYPVYDSLGNVVDHEEPVGNADMYWIFHRFSGLGTGELFPDDIAGIQAIYGPGRGSVSPLAIPEPTTLALALITCALIRPSTLNPRPFPATLALALLTCALCVVLPRSRTT